MGVNHRPKSGQRFASSLQTYLKNL